MAEEKEVTIKELRDAINARGLKFNELLEAFQGHDERLTQIEHAVREVQAVQRDAALNGGGAAAGALAGVGPQLQQILADIADLKARPVPALMASELKQAQQTALVREAKAHQGDRMMYHSNPAHPKPGIVVRTDAEERAAVIDGYLPNLRDAALAGLKADAPEADVLARMEAIKKGMFKTLAA